MKAPVLGLLAATAAFAGSSIYLWVQLDNERDRSAQVAETARQLNARIAALEKARGEFDQRRVANSGTAAGTFGSIGAGAAMPAGKTSADGKADAVSEPQVWGNARPDRSPAFQKMMRAQIRASTRRQYADVGEKLGLSKDKTTQLMELLAEQQAAMMISATEFTDPQQVERDFEQRQRDQEMAISDLIGPDKAMALKEFQETLPARQEFEMLARQLEDNGAALNESQKKRLVEVVIEERKRVPMPEYVDGMDQVEYAKSVNAWKSDYDKRVADEASHILNNEQLTAYNEIQQWQKDLREQFESSGVAMVAPNTRMRRVVGQANAVTFTTAAPLFVSGPATTEKEPKKP